MLSWLFLAIIGANIRLTAAVDKIHGVHPALLSKYAPLAGSANKWTCLDGSKTILWAAVNDDYCDCLDGSDEPGTSACPNATFYCNNDGHIGASIRSSRVNDGLCEPECCDGSDEQSGVCPNICKEVGKEYRTRVEAENKIRKTGSKIRSSYITYASKEKKRLEDLVASTSQEVAQREKEVDRLRDILDQAENTSAAALEHKKQSPLYQSLLKHAAALKGLKREHNKLMEKEKTLSDILSALRAGYNPNYQDMAVLEAVRGYEFYAKLPSSNDRDRAKEEEGTEDNSEDSGSEQEDDGEELGEDEWSNEQMEDDLDDLLDEDHVSLLMEHDQHIGLELTRFTSILQYGTLRDSVVSVLEKVGIIRLSKEAEDGTKSLKARTIFQSAEQELIRVRRDKESAQLELARLYDPAWYGSEGEWKKLDGQCLSKDTGEYTYEVCLFGEARQKPNNGGSTFILGKFEHWNTESGVEPGSSKYYGISRYTHGARCWNGPERSVTLLLSCGTENAILGISEPEKCEYHITGTSPVLCRAPGTESSNNAGKGRGEL